MLPVRKTPWFTDDAEDGLNVFVPGLMVTGIIVSMVMLVSDGIRRLIPSRGKKARAVRIELRSMGRIRDLTSVGLGVAPTPPRIERVARSRVSAFVLAAAALAVAGILTVATVGAYTSPGTTLYERGWTLSFGLGLAAVPALIGILTLLSAVFRAEGPEWVRAATRHWPVGTLPHVDELHAGS